MKFYERLSFRAKLILQAMLTATVAVVLALIAIGSYDLLRDRQRVAESTLNYAEQLASTLAAAMAFDDVRTAEQSLAVLANDPQITAAVARSSDGVLFASYTRADVAAVPPPSTSGAGSRFFENRLEISRDIALDGDRLGTLSLHRSLDDIDAGLRQRNLIGLGVFILSVVTTRMVSVGSIAAAIALAIAVFFFHADPVLRAITVAVALLVIIRHRTNIGRVMRGEESRIWGAPKAGEPADETETDT